MWAMTEISTFGGPTIFMDDDGNEYDRRGRPITPERAAAAAECFKEKARRRELADLIVEVTVLDRETVLADLEAVLGPVEEDPDYWVVTYIDRIAGAEIGPISGGFHTTPPRSGPLPHGSGMRGAHTKQFE